MNGLVVFQELKSGNENYVEQLVSELKANTFTSMTLPKDIAEKAANHLHNIAHRHHCCIKTELMYKNQHVSVPRATSAAFYASNAIKEQSNMFCSSSDVVTKITVTNGSIEIGVGDISQQQASLNMMICLTSNILLGRYDYRLDIT